ncbi:MAG: GNAT family N-acetyltransferase [Azospirillaceae bacterium]
MFARTAAEVPGFIYEAFYPEGWEARQAADVGALLDGEPEGVWLALLGEDLAGFVGVRLLVEDRMGEVHIIAVDPAWQRRGIGRRLMSFAEAHCRAHGMAMVMVETVGDSGHQPARRAYESFGYVPWPVARYFKAID